MNTRLLLFSLICMIAACGVRDDLSNADLELSSQEFAIPLINTKLSIEGLADVLPDGAASIRIDEQGRATAIYNGTLARNEAESIFPPVPGIGDNVLPDTNSMILLPFREEDKIQEAEFGLTNMSFYFENPTTDPLNVKVTIPSLSLDGVIWTKTYEVPATSEGIAYETEATNLRGQLLLPINNEVQFIYEAISPTGERLTMEYAAMRVDVIVFERIVGYFGKRTFKLSGNSIDINIFNSWLSGGLDFENPRFNITVENSFGFPTRSQVNILRVKTSGGNVFDITGTPISDGVNFAYPTFQEGTTVKLSEFFFDRTNSNLRELFNDKVVQVDYDIDALINPDDDASITNFINSDAYFQVNLFVEVPMFGKALNYRLGDTTDIDLSQLADASNAEFKIIHKNGFPGDLSTQGYFLSEDGSVLDSIFSSGPIMFEAATLGNDGIAIPPAESTILFEDFTAERLDKIKDSKKLYIVGELDTSEKYGSELWIYNDYSLDLKLGAKVRLDEN